MGGIVLDGKNFIVRASVEYIYIYIVVVNGAHVLHGGTAKTDSLPTCFAPLTANCQTSLFSFSFSLAIRATLTLIHATHFIVCLGKSKSSLALQRISKFVGARATLTHALASAPTTTRIYLCIYIYIYSWSQRCTCPPWWNRKNWLTSNLFLIHSQQIYKKGEPEQPWR